MPMGFGRFPGRAVVMVAVLRMTMIAHRAVGMAHPAIGQVHVIVVVLVDGQCRRGAGTEELPVFRA